MVKTVKLCKGEGCDKPLKYGKNYCSITCFNKSDRKRDLDRQRQLKFVEEGWVPWNKGLTNETSQVLAERSEMHSKRLTGVTSEQRYGAEKAKSKSEKCRAAMKQIHAEMSEEEKIEWMAATRTVAARDKKNLNNTGFRRTIYGKYYSEKNRTEIQFDSSYELLACVRLERDPTVIRYGRCRFGVSYFFEGGAHRYYPDFLIELVDGSQKIIEVKPKTQLGLPKNVAKRQAVLVYCKENNLDFVVLTEEDLFKDQNYKLVVENRKDIIFASEKSEQKFEKFLNKSLCE